MNQADAVYLAQIYGSAREVDHGDVKVEDLAAKIDKKHQVITVENVSPLLDHDDAVSSLWEQVTFNHMNTHSNVSCLI